MRARPLSAAVALAAALLLAPALTGCGMIEGFVEQASDGAVDISMGSLPDGWPAEVPVIDGDVVFGGTATNEDGSPGWNATITVDENAFESIKSQLEGAGFEQADAGELEGDVTSAAFSNENYTVLVAVTGADGNFVANYTVFEAVTVP